MATECVFCGPTRHPITAEHLIPDWVSWVLHPKRKKKQFRLWHRNLEGRNHSWHADSINYKARLLCQPCNNEVFSQLEEHVKPIVGPMILEGRATTLKLEDRLALAAWVFKMALIHHHIHEAKVPDNRLFTPAERRAFRDTFEVPSGVLIWLARFIGDKRNESAPIAGVLQGYDDTNQLFRGIRTHMFAFALGQFAAQVLTVRRHREVAKPLDELMTMFQIDSGWRHGTVRLWPIDTPDLLFEWPPSAALPRQALQALYERFGHESIELWPNVRRGLAPEEPVLMLLDHNVPRRSPK